ncbi:hypothetical protein BHQ21_25460 [Mycobacterium sherrisii]|uniref:Uncharacterized protein n=1 Tax=Mycobacterium sherrisii TaxID=243061 RepID=A0A1E3SC64_9MYCO|nr:ribbon-helix-helix domain-containing protein [Mycobacterium sherrisii]ODQ99157.1 hypothetical protein BHQ21_25460 [Mycobacterium sherrisii]
MVGLEGTSAERIVKVPFPLPLIRRMDESIVAGRGGFQSRAELMREAVENLLNELDFPEAPAEPALAREFMRLPPAPVYEQAVHPMLDEVPGGLPPWEREELTLADLAGTALLVPEHKPKIPTGGQAPMPDEPLLGLHNRDYPSIWALHRLARYTADDLIGFNEYLERATKAAWYYGAQLESLDQRDRRDRSRKLTILFPTNTAKQPSAERGFQTFAIGGLARSNDSGALTASGPLFAWGAIQVEEAADGLPTGLTENGWRLICELDGLSLDLPHPPRLARLFMSYLAEHAPADWWGFGHLLHAVADRPSRDEVVRRFHSFHEGWSDATASSIAQGYIARSREWGLVEPRLVDGRYWLTNSGRELLDRSHTMNLVIRST